MKLTPITNPVALRRDTTVGTRIFSGNTMIHGDTGWRRVFDASTQPSADWIDGHITIRRVNDQVFANFDLNCTAGTGPAVASGVFPSGFHPPSVPGGSGARTFAGLLGSNAGITLSQVAVYVNDFYYRGPPGNTTHNFTREPRNMRGTLSWSTGQPWPSTLPGLPD